MIEILIFHLHIVAAVYIFTKYWRTSRVREGFMGLSLFILLFSIGWPMMTFIVNLCYPDNWETIFFNKDTLSLLMLTSVEVYFFKHFFLKDKQSDISIEEKLEEL